MGPSSQRFRQCPARFAGAVLPVRPRPPNPGVSGGSAPSGRQPVSRQPKPVVLSLGDHPGRPGGLSPAVAGAVSASWSDSTRRACSGQWRQFVVRAGDAGVPWLPSAPVDIAEYLTALVGRGAGLATVRQAGPVLSPGLRTPVRSPVVRTAISAFTGPFWFASLCPGPPGCRDFPSPQPKKIEASPWHMPDPPSLSCCCNIGENAQKSPGQMRHSRLPPPAEDDLRRTLGTEAGGTGASRHGGPRVPGPREGCLQLRIRRYRHRCSNGRIPDRGIQGYSPLARDVDSSARSGG